MDVHVPGIIWLHGIPDGVPQLASTVPLRHWYCGARFILFSFIETLLVACFVTTG